MTFLFLVVTSDLPPFLPLKDPSFSFLFSYHAPPPPPVPTQTQKSPCPVFSTVFPQPNSYGARMTPYIWFVLVFIFLTLCGALKALPLPVLHLSTFSLGIPTGRYFLYLDELIDVFCHWCCISAPCSASDHSNWCDLRTCRSHGTPFVFPSLFFPTYITTYFFF